MSKNSASFSVEVLLLALAQILDHHLRRPEHQDRVFGMLLGQRSGPNKVTVTSALGLPHVVKPPNLLTMDFEDLESDKTMALVSRALAASANPNDQEPTMILGWYATSPELNSYTPLIHERFANKLAASVAALPVTAFSSSSSSAHSSALQAVHLTLDPTSLEFKTFVTAPVGLGGRSLNAIFVPVENHLEVSETEKPTLDVLLSAPAASKSIAPRNPLQQFKATLTQVGSMLDRVSAHVEAVLNGTTKGDPDLAALLLDTVSNAVLPALGQGEEFENFETQLADLLMISYLSNLAKLQVELAGRLALLPDKGSA